MKGSLGFQWATLVTSSPRSKLNGTNRGYELLKIQLSQIEGTGKPTEGDVRAVICMSVNWQLETKEDPVHYIISRGFFVLFFFLQFY